MRARRSGEIFSPKVGRLPIGKWMADGREDAVLRWNTGVCYATPPAHIPSTWSTANAPSIIVHYQSYESRGIPRAIVGLSTPWHHEPPVIGLIGT